MDLRQLKTFAAVARTLNFTRAADLLDYAQSSVTAQIQSLEAELGVLLFERLGKRIVLTDSGERLMDYAGKMLRMADEAYLAVSRPEEVVGRLVIGAPETLSTYRLPPLLRLFRKKYPAVQLILASASPEQAVVGLSDGTFDVAIMLVESAGDEPSLITKTLVEEPLLLLAPPDHPLVFAPQVHPADLRQETVLLTHPGCTYRTLFERILAADGVYLSTTMEFSSVEAIKQCVMADIGITLLPRVAVCTELDQGRLVALQWPKMHINTQIMWHRQKTILPALKEFIHLCETLFLS